MGIRGWSFVGMVEVCGASGGGGGVVFFCLLFVALTRFVRRCAPLYCCRSPISYTYLAVLFGIICWFVIFIVGACNICSGILIFMTVCMFVLFLF